MTENIPNTNPPPTKLTMKDFIGSTYDTKNNIGVNSKYSINSIPKNQREFGQRKRIKPWRTGTKSQQQIQPKGFKKGFRG